MDYSYKLVYAERHVNDTFNQGKLSIAAFIYKPTAADRQEVVLFNHGDLSWGLRPNEFDPCPPVSVLKFWLTRGYTVVAVVRRGLRFSTGTYIEERSFGGSKRTVAELREQVDLGLDSATADTNAVIDQVILNKPTFAGKIWLCGQSRGGMVSIAVAGERPELFAGAVVFSAGWLSVLEHLPVDENVGRVRVMRERFTHAGERFRGRTLWFYGEHDQFFQPKITRSFFDSFVQAGGQGAYLLLPGRHGAYTDLSLWERSAETFISAAAQDT